ncbi:MAG: hypothetical protein OHK0022_30550 [Roseiflexaceae bacterium]
MPTFRIFLISLIALLLFSPTATPAVYSGTFSQEDITFTGPGGGSPASTESTNSRQKDATSFSVKTNESIIEFKDKNMVASYEIQHTGTLPENYTFYPHNAKMSDLRLSFAGGGQCRQGSDKAIRCTGTITSLFISYKYSYSLTPDGMYIDFTAGYKLLGGNFTTNIVADLNFVPENLQYMRTDTSPSERSLGHLSWQLSNTTGLRPTTKLRVQSPWESLELLERDYKSKIGTVDEWYSKFWLCLNRNACGDYKNTKEAGIAGDFNKYMFDYMKAHPFNSALRQRCWYFPDPSETPDDIRFECFMRAGVFHFRNELVPGFYSYAKAIDPALYAQWDSVHESFVRTHNLPCFDEVLGSAFQDRPEYRNILITKLKRDTLLTATDIRERAQFYYTQRNLSSSSALQISSTYPAPLRKEDLFSPELFSVSPIKIQASDNQFFLNVGTSVQLKSVVTANNTPVDITKKETGTVYNIVAPEGAVTITQDGLLTIHKASSPMINERTVVYVFAHNGSSYGVGQFSIVDSDADADLLSDSYERLYGLNPAAPNSLTSDVDGDRLDDHSELILGSNPLVKDTDKDGFSDYTEYQADSDIKDASCTPRGCFSYVYLPMMRR